MKILKWTTIIILVALVGFISAVFIYLQSSRPVYHGEMYGRGTQEDVKVHFDHYGIPHIFAANEKDAYFALGYIHAQERLFQMELLRRVGSGRLAEILGKDLTSVDAFFRTLGIAKAAKESASMFFAKPTEQWQKNTLAYIKGINSFMFQGATPPEFLILGIPKVKFTPEDIYLIAGYMAFSFAEALRMDPILDKIYHKYGMNYLNSFEWSNGTDSVLTPDSAAVTASALPAFTEQLLEKLPVKPWIGSNAWVLAPSRSITGGVLLANDTHIGFQQPAVWFEAHIEYPGFSLYGNYLAGLPFPLLGHNRSISWGLTMLENDDMNLYREEPVPGNPDLYNYKGVHETYKKNKETINVKGHADTVITIRETVHGPVINDVLKQLDPSEKHPVSLWWSYTKFPVTALQVTYQLSRATNLDEARNAAAKVNAPGLNIVYGDVNGNIAHWIAAKLPVYKRGLQTKLILDGSSGNDDIQGFYEFNQNPHHENPASGVLVSSNQPPDTIDGSVYPGYYPPSFRADRISKLLATQEKWTVNEMKTITNDIVSDVHPRYAKLIMDVIGDDPVTTLTPVHVTASRLLRTWSGNHATTDTTPTIYYRLLSNIFEMSMKDELGETDYNIFVNTHVMKNSYERFLSDDSSGWWDNIETKNRLETRKLIFVAAFRTTIAGLQESSGEITNWAWGGAHTLEHVHPIGRKKPLDKIFNVGPTSIRGGLETINNTGFHLNTKGKYEVTYGAATRILMDLKDMDNAISILPTGQSGHLRSPHYFDQHRMHVDCLFRPMMMNKAEIIEQCTNVITFKPQ